MKKNILASMLFAMIVITSCGPSKVVVREKPVAPVYVRPLAPAPNYVWIDGGWVKNSRKRYVYKHGYWVSPRPQYRNISYTQCYWRQTRRGYVWVPGRW
ncbi:MAG: hypothetical protein ABIT07_13195 [Ferruginibacter sp.]